MTAPRMHGFTPIAGDVDYLSYGGTWCRRVGGQRFHFVRLGNWVDMVGERDAKADGLPSYNIELAEVDLDQLRPGRIRDALESCGDPDATDAVERALACFEYGAKAPLLNENGGNWRRLFAAAARESRAVAADPAALDQRTVNRVGQTAREYLTGDMGGAVTRGLEASDPTVSLIVRMYKAANYQTLGGGPAEDVRAAVEGR